MGLCMKGNWPKNVVTGLIYSRGSDSKKERGDHHKANPNPPITQSAHDTRTLL